MSKQLPVDRIRIDGETQMRIAGLDESIVDQYAEDMANGASFPAAVVFFDGVDYWLADGFHRVAACKRLKRKTVDVEIHEGGVRDAKLYAMKANVAHGLRATRKDKQNAVGIMLRDPEWTGWSDREIGRQCGVDGKTVAAMRERLGIAAPAERTGSDGRKINTANIGAKAPAGESTAEIPQSDTALDVPALEEITLTDKQMENARKEAEEYGLPLEAVVLARRVALLKRKATEAERERKKLEREALRKKLEREARKRLDAMPKARRDAILKTQKTLEELSEDGVDVTVADLIKLVSDAGKM